MAAPSLLPLFALPGTVCYPHGYLPLHVFEPRYRQLVRDAAAASGQIGIIAYDLTQGDDYDEADRLHPIGTLGIIEHLQPQGDGRFNIMLRGVRRFALESLEGGKPYRLGRVHWLDDRAGVSSVEALRQLPVLQESFTYLDPDYDELYRAVMNNHTPDEAYVVLCNSLLGLLDLNYPLNQELLELDSAVARLRHIGSQLPHHLLLARLVKTLRQSRTRLEAQDPALN